MQRAFITILAIVLGGILVYTGSRTKNPTPPIHTPLFSGTPLSNGGPEDPNAREQYNWDRLKDPASGEIPSNMRMRELAFTSSIPERADRSGYTFSPKGPWNVGGRTRAFAVDVTDEDHLLAGGVSGGMWQSTDGGQNWSKTTDPGDHHSVSCLAQDTRTGKTTTWYYGSGEVTGNSASASFSANYLGNGLYKSTDNGQTWVSLPATVTGSPQSSEPWDLIWDVVVDPSNLTQDEVYAAANGRVFRSDDGGSSWTSVLGGTGLLSTFMDLAITPTGVVYASLSSNGSTSGIWRSPDGITWTRVNPNGGVFPSTYGRLLMSVNPQNENSVYLFGNTPNNGLLTNVFFNGTAWTSMLKYEYKSGDGSGSNGVWIDLSQNLPNNLGVFGNFYSQGSYDVALGFKPNDTNTVFLGGTNLYRSTDGFTSPNNTSWIGGYEPFTTLPYFDIYENHHPDQHGVAFSPTNPDVMFSYNDGGVSRTDDCLANTVTWTSLNNGYQTSQLYTIAIDHGTVGSNVIICGTQDNGSWWTNSNNLQTPWTFPSTGDGAHCAVEDGGGTYYFSRQNGRMLKTELDVDGEVVRFNRFDPIGGSNYLFINPFILDPVDNNVMYLAAGTRLWRNDSLSDIPYANEYDSISLGWKQYSNAISNNSITAMAASVANPPHRLYFGNRSRRIYRLDSANVGDPTAVDITAGITSGGYTHCIAIDPRDADKLMVVYSNYNILSLWYSDDAGDNWTSVAGNLEETQPAGFPPGYGDGPSCRWAVIVPHGNQTSFLVGTSTGLFSTDTLLGDSTVWVKEGATSVGNVVVDMMAYRHNDGFLAVGTHGNGVYTSNLLSTGLNEFQLKEPAFSVYPNPANGHVTVNLESAEKGNANLQLFDQQGRLVQNLWQGQVQTSINNLNLNLSEHPAGVYFLRLTQSEGISTRKLVLSR